MTEEEVDSLFWVLRHVNPAMRYGDMIRFALYEHPLDYWSEVQWDLCFAGRAGL